MIEWVALPNVDCNPNVEPVNAPGSMMHIIIAGQEMEGNGEENRAL